MRFFGYLCRTNGVRGAREATAYYHPTTVYNDVKYIIKLCTYRDDNNIVCTIPTCKLIRGRSMCAEGVDGLCSKIKNKRPEMRFASYDNSSAENYIGVGCVLYKQLFRFAT